MLDGGEDGGAQEEVEEVGEDEEDHPPSRPHPGLSTVLTWPILILTANNRDTILALYLHIVCTVNTPRYTAPVIRSPATRASNEPSRSLKLYHHGEALY